MLAIALTKGRLEKTGVQIFEKAGYGVEELKNKGRQLVFHDTVKDNEYFLVKAVDCITYVIHGVADVGIVGKDTIVEHPGSYYEIMDLDIGKCGFVLAGLPGHNPNNKVGHVIIGTKYPTITKQYFENRGMDVEIIKIEGSVELSPIIGLCDAIVDITETGSTLRENGLVIFDRITDISARLIVNPASFKLKRQEIEQLIQDIKTGKEELSC